MFLIKNVIDLEAFQNLVLAEWKRSLEQVPTNGITFFQIDDQKDSIKNIFLPTFLSSKVKVLLDDLGKVAKLGDKSVVVSQWNAMLDVIQWHLERSKVVATTITGKVASKQRQKRADDFNRGEAQVLLMSSGVEAGGIDLTGANHLFFVDLQWDPASEQEIIGRIHCIGQKKDVIVHKLVAEDTVDEQILEEQAEKTAAVEEILHEFSSDQCCCSSDEGSLISEE
uniref:Helicase C-terminal domain-containing protein n=1 Tax=Panagrolaimus sp. JU765 TaxID=591449 RepID=A0AC34Q0P1_9BILA